MPTIFQRLEFITHNSRLNSLSTVSTDNVVKKVLEIRKYFLPSEEQIKEDRDIVELVKRWNKGWSDEVRRRQKALSYEKRKMTSSIWRSKIKFLTTTPRQKFARCNASKSPFSLRPRTRRKWTLRESRFPQPIMKGNRIIQGKSIYLDCLQFLKLTKGNKSLPITTTVQFVPTK